MRTEVTRIVALFSVVGTVACSGSEAGGVATASQGLGLGAGIIEGSAPWVPATVGCPMAHCSPTMDDQVHLPVPAAPVEVVQVLSNTGSNYALGCSSNGDRAVCSMQLADRGPFLRAFNGDGTEAVTIEDELTRGAWTSAPMVDGEGGFVAADDESVARFQADGSVLWKYPLPSPADVGIPVRYRTVAGNRPVSTSLTASGVVVVATTAGVVAGFNVKDGTPTGATYLSDPEQAGVFATRNSPLVIGDQLFLATELIGPEDAPPIGRMYALDVAPADPGLAPEDAFSVVGEPFEFRARSGGTPTLADGLIWFDGDGLDYQEDADPQLFALKMEVDGPEIVANLPQEAPGTASPAVDPRGGVWTYAFGASKLNHFVHVGDGAIQQQPSIDLAELHGVPARDGFHWTPASALTIAEGPEGRPAIITSFAEQADEFSGRRFDRTDADLTQGALGNVFLMAVDLERRELLWEVPLGEGLLELAPGQFPIAMDGSDPAIFFSTTQNGHYLLRTQR